MLKNLLPLLRESDAHTLNNKQRSILNSSLLESKDEELLLAILTSLPRVGDASSIPYVRELTQQRTFLPSHYRVRRAARVCLPLLQERVRSLKELSTAPDDFATNPALVPAEQMTRTTSEKNVVESLPEKSSLSQLEAERQKVSRPAMRIGFLLADWCIIVPFGAAHAFDSFASHQWLAGGVWSAFTLAATQLYRVALSPKRATMMRIQVQQRDIKAVGVLAEALEWPEEDLRFEAGAALTVLLPLLKASDSSLLNSEQRASLHSVLKLSNAQKQGELILSILEAFEQVGDTAAIPFVEQLAAAKPRTPAEQAIVTAAQECLPYLRICAGNNTARHSLLRASSQQDTAAMDNLLRPIRETPDTRPEQLLRPSNSEES